MKKGLYNQKVKSYIINLLRRFISILLVSCYFHVTIFNTKRSCKKYTLRCDFLDILGNIKLSEVHLHVFSNFAFFYYDANLSCQCKWYVIFAFLRQQELKWNESPSINFFIKYVYPNVICFKIFFIMNSRNDRPKYRLYMLVASKGM